MKRKLSVAEQEWWNTTAWCAIFAILKVASHFDSTVKVMMTSDSDLLLLRKSWQKKVPISQNPQMCLLHMWPSINELLMRQVFRDVYNLQCEEILLDISFRSYSFDNLKDYGTLYMTTGVGVVLCQDAVDRDRHVVMFETNGTRDAVFFEDTKTNSREPNWHDWTKDFVVYRVYIVLRQTHNPTRAAVEMNV
jgi:hypothetical protein